jgi:hypothetical protein
VVSDGRAIVSAFDPQSDVERSSYETPVLAPAALAWRLFNARGDPLTPLEWALRGSQNYPPALKPVIFAPGATNPGFNCFAYRVICIPKLDLLAGRRSDRTPAARSAVGRALPAGDLRLGLGWEHCRTRSLDHRPGAGFRSGARGSSAARPEPQ